MFNKDLYLQLCEEYGVQDADTLEGGIIVDGKEITTEEFKDIISPSLDWRTMFAGLESRFDMLGAVKLNTEIEQLYRYSNWVNILADFDCKDYIIIEAWETIHHSDDSKIIALIYDSGEVVYKDNKAKTDKYAQYVINNVLNGLTD